MDSYKVVVHTHRWTEPERKTLYAICNVNCFPLFWIESEMSGTFAECVEFIWETGTQLRAPDDYLPIINWYTHQMVVLVAPPGNHLYQHFDREWSEDSEVNDKDSLARLGGWQEEHGQGATHVLIQRNGSASSRDRAHYRVHSLRRPIPFDWHARYPRESGDEAACADEIKRITGSNPQQSEAGVTKQEQLLEGLLLASGAAFDELLKNVPEVFGSSGIDEVIASFIKRLTDSGYEWHPLAANALVRIGSVCVGSLSTASNRNSALGWTHKNAPLSEVLARIRTNEKENSSYIDYLSGQWSAETLARVESGFVELGPVKVGEVIEKLNDRATHHEAVALLREAEFPPEMSSLLQVLNTDNANLRGRVASLIAKIGADALISFLSSKLEQGDPETRYSAAWQLGRLGEPAVDVLISKLRGADTNLQLLVLHGLQAARSDQAIEALRALIANNDYRQIREQAKRVVREIEIARGIYAPPVLKMTDVSQPQLPHPKPVAPSPEQVIECPVCFEDLDVVPTIDEVVWCAECNTEFHVTGLDPIELDEIVSDDDDFGDDDEDDEY